MSRGAVRMGDHKQISSWIGLEGIGGRASGVIAKTLPDCHHQQMEMEKVRFGYSIVENSYLEYWQKYNIPFA